MRVIALLAHFALSLVPATQAQNADTASIFRRARQAEDAFEWRTRRDAPLSHRPSSGTECDEVIGRYCVTYETGREALPPEPSRVAEARDTAIAHLRAAAAVAPARDEFVFPLVRYLARARRADEAVTVAQAYARARPVGGEGHMVLGFALHEARRTDEAKAELETWLSTLPEAERDRTQSLDWLLDVRERRRYSALRGSDRLGYEAQAWKYADPLYITPGNELWTDHLARHAVSRMMPLRRVSIMGRWGSDDHQLTVRFGLPVLIMRSWRSGGGLGASEQYSEHWDESQRTYFPPIPDSALAMPASLDTVWPLDSLPSRSGHAPPTIRQMRVLEHQVAAFPELVRVRGVVRTDSLVKNPLTGKVFLLDSALNIIASADAAACVACPAADSAMLVADLPLYPGARFYSAELYDPVSRFAARARYQLELPSATETLVLSGILLAQPFDPGWLPADRMSALLRPLSRPVLPRGQRLGVYAELTNRSAQRRTVRIAIETRSIDRRSALTRAAGWLGEKLGLSSRRTPANVGWMIELEPGVATPLPVTLDLGVVPPGHYCVTMTVRDPATGEDLIAARDFRI
ncbi:MAG: hypothetical protein ACT4O1_14030 [Gemmatimonadota bacterium]